MKKINSNKYLLPPLMPSLFRYRNLFLRKGRLKSITRILQYEALLNYQFTGKILDIGGGERADYKELISCNTYDSVNIDSAIQPTWIVEIGGDLPCSDKEYDFVLSMNTFEHIFDVNQVLRETFRVLKSDGKFVTAVPFLHPIHGHPDDFFRPTSSWWYQSLTNIGFKEVTVIPLSWGPFTTGFACSGQLGPGKVFRRHIALLMDIFYAALHRHRRSIDVIEGNLSRLPLAFFVAARK